MSEREGGAPRSDTATIIAALRGLADDIQSGDGVANAVVAEAADRLAELHAVALALIGAEMIDGRGSRSWGLGRLHEAHALARAALTTNRSAARD